MMLRAIISPGLTFLARNLRQDQMSGLRLKGRKERISDQLQTILFGAPENLACFYAPLGKSALANAAALINDHQFPDKLIVFNPEIWQLNDERIQVLGKLYLSLNASDRRVLLGMVRLGLTRQSSYAKYSAHLLTFVAKYHSLERALDWVLKNLPNDETSFKSLSALSNLLKYDPGLPSDAQLDRIIMYGSKKKGEFQPLVRRSKAAPSSATENLSNTVRSRLDRIIQQAQELKYGRLRDRLMNDANLEINQDREILTRGLVNFGFPNEFIESLEHAEAEYRKAESKFDFKTSVDHNRSFFEALMWETAGKVASIRKEQLTARRKAPVEVREYLHKAGFLSDRFHKLCEAFYHFASEQSTHQLASGREIARVVRNLNIELGLLMLRRLESFS
jgi:hypothetical protein